MKWGCPNAAPLGRAPQDADYYGHTLERVGADRWVGWTGWRCQWCGESFKMPDEPDSYELPLMESVETEDLPTDVLDAALFALAIGASNNIENGTFSAAIDALLGEERWPEWRVPSTDLAYRASRVAGLRDDLAECHRRAWAECLIRTGEVAL